VLGEVEGRPREEFRDLVFLAVGGGDVVAPQVHAGGGLRFAVELAAAVGSSHDEEGVDEGRCAQDGESRLRVASEDDAIRRRRVVCDTFALWCFENELDAEGWRGGGRAGANIENSADGSRDGAVVVWHVADDALHFFCRGCDILAFVGHQDCVRDKRDATRGANDDHTDREDKLPVVVEYYVHSGVASRLFRCPVHFGRLEA
jgi:hypothetical protein